MNRAKYEENLLHNVLDSIQRHGGTQLLSSVILTGSFGRDEQTYVTEPNHSVRLKSDVEIALVFPKCWQKKKVETLANCVSEEFSEELNLMPISERRLRHRHNFNYTIKTPRRKTLFTYDLFNGSKTIWGEDFLTQRKVCVQEVDPYEAKRLVANRIGELVCTEADAGTSMQWRGKVILAVGSAWLLARGEYLSSCAAQCERLKAMQQELERDVGIGFYREYERVFRYLRQNQAAYEVVETQMREYVRNIDAYFRKLGLNRARVNSISRMAKCCAKYYRTGLQYGLFGFEDRILQELLSGYSNGKTELLDTAWVWKRVLY